MGWLFHLGQAEILVEFFDRRLEEDRGALGFDEFDDLHGGFESYGCRGLLVAQNVSKSVECKVGESAEFVDYLVGALLAEGEEGAGEVREGAGPEVDGGAVDPGFAGRGGDGEARDKALQHLDLNRRQGVEL